MDELLQSFLYALFSQYPVMTTIFAVIGVLRTVNKPLFMLLKAFASATETKRDDEIIVEVESSKVYRAVSFVLDWTLSVKIPPKKITVEVEEKTAA